MAIAYLVSARSVGVGDYGQTLRIDAEIRDTEKENFSSNGDSASADEAYREAQRIRERFEPGGGRSKSLEICDLSSAACHNFRDDKIRDRGISRRWER